MAKGRERFEKRQLQKAKQEKQAAKREKRHTKKDQEPDEAVDEAALMDEFRILSEQKEAGALDEETFESERHRIFVALGLEEPVEGEDDTDTEDE
jgi:hypothetical protein